VARWVADAATAPLVLLDQIARIASEVPMAALDVAPGVFTALCMGVLTGALVVATARRRVLPPLLVGVAALVVALWVPALARGPGLLELHMVDVGQGDALALRTPRGRWVLIDAGRVWTGGDAGRRAVVPYVRRRGGEVALFVLTHPDADHVGGAPSVLEALRPDRWWDPGFVHTSDVYREALAVARRHAIPWRRAEAGDSLHIDGVLLTVLGPDSAWLASQRSANDASAVLMVQHGRLRFLLTGDAEAAEEAWLVDRWGDALAATVLKVGHHGSRTSSTPALLDAVRPQVALVSVGAGNRYGHPAPEVLDALAARGVELLRTDRDGDIILRSDGRTLALETRFARWTRDVP
jgi:competence protein ComEC